MINFKNTGTREFQTNISTLNIRNNNNIPISIKTPVQFGEEEIFSMHKSIEDSIHDNFKNLLLTNHGDRVNNYDFGADLYPLVAEFTSKENFETEAMNRISAAVSKFMPYINLIGFESRPEYINDQFLGTITILIVYSVPVLGINEKSIELVLTVY